MHSRISKLLLAFAFFLGANLSPALELNQPVGDGRAPRIVHVELLPWHGMNFQRIQAYLPGKGVINLLAPEGGPILVPFANRIRGEFIAQDQEIETRIAGRRVRLPAPWKGGVSSEWHAMHGLFLKSKADRVESQGIRARAVYDLGNFGGHWLSKTQLEVEVDIHENTLGLKVNATNVGDEELPMGIGWHPYFSVPGGDRTQARLELPARARALVNNYGDVFPTGEFEEVAGTRYDFRKPRPLADLFLDDCFTDLLPSRTAVLEDPLTGYQLRVRASSPEIQAIQVYAPVDKSFIAIEPQFNLANPFGEEWKGARTGIVELKPGESVTYEVRVEVFALR